MTGPDHYRAAEATLRDAAPGGQGDARGEVDQYVARAQVHATLALAAATVTAHTRGSATDPARQWSAVLS